MHSKSDETSQNETVKNDREPVGLMPDSDQFISRLESKLKRISSKNPNRVTGKDLIKNMAEFKEIYMTDYLKDTSKFSTSEQAFNQDDFNSSELNSTDKNSFLEVQSYRSYKSTF